MSNSCEQLTTVKRESSCKPTTKGSPVANQKSTINDNVPVNTNGIIDVTVNGGHTTSKPSSDETITPATNIFNRYNFKYIDDPDTNTGDDGIAYDSNTDRQEDVVDASMSIQKKTTALQQNNIKNNDVKRLLAGANVVQSNCGDGKGHERQAVATIASRKHNGDDAIDITLEQRTPSGTLADCNGNFFIYISAHTKNIAFSSECVDSKS